MSNLTELYQMMCDAIIRPQRLRDGHELFAHGREVGGAEVAAVRAALALLPLVEVPRIQAHDPCATIKSQ